MATKVSGFDAEKHAARLLTLTNYINRPGFVQSVGWDREDNADVLVDRKSKNLTVLVVVGKASANKMWCGPLGNFAAETTYGDFNKAKFQFTISRPDEPALAREYEKALKMMAVLQRDIAKTSKLEYFLVNEGLDMRFGQPLFEKRAIPVTNVPKFSPKGNYAVDGAVLLETLFSTTPPPDALESDVSSNTIDDDDVDGLLDDATRDYAKYIPSGTQKKYHDLMKDFAVTPLRLFKTSGQWIKPDSAEAFMQGALVECHFSFKHFWIKNTAVPYDTFSGSLEQVIWLRAGVRRAVTGDYGKRTNLEMGLTAAPVSRKAFKSTSGASASNSPASRVVLATPQVTMDAPTTPAAPSTEGEAIAPAAPNQSVPPPTSEEIQSAEVNAVDSDAIAIANVPAPSMPVIVTPLQVVASIDPPVAEPSHAAQLLVLSETIIPPALAMSPSGSGHITASGPIAPTIDVAGDPPLSVDITPAQPTGDDETPQPGSSHTTSVRAGHAGVISDERADGANAGSVSVPSVQKDKVSVVERKPRNTRSTKGGE
ncbi:hypothetical protein HWV62_29553 [Athelia sp. TMB]|nr:hypothetical protein HWV62_29553 [Athelia sp. TMB]